jgi:hypothetical protein
MDLMNERQWKRWDVVERVNQGQLTMGEAATICGLSIRQLRPPPSGRQKKRPTSTLYAKP